MKLIAIGDVHGRDDWKQADTTTADKVVFLGDYVDSYYFKDEEIQRNLEAIIQFKLSEPDKVVLLIGNHDAQYIHFPDYSCSGLRPTMRAALSGLFAQYSQLFQIAYQQEMYLFTHAGVSNDWYHYREQYIDQIDPGAPLADQLNGMYQRGSTTSFLFDVGPKRGGNEAFGGPVWADRSETVKDYLTHYHQVVGHTRTPEIVTFGNAASSITYIDVTETKTEFYELVL